jgi:mannose-6-phosphate isomerase-like protein (cupin superfamily)
VKGGEPSYEFESLDFQANDRKLSGYVAFFREVDPKKAKPHAHPGVELIYVVRGRLGIRILDEDRVLDAGDSIYFDSTAPHSYRRVGRAPCEAVVVTTG